MYDEILQIHLSSLTLVVDYRNGISKNNELFPAKCSTNISLKSTSNDKVLHLSQRPISSFELVQLVVHRQNAGLTKDINDSSFLLLTTTA